MRRLAAVLLALAAALAGLAILSWRVGARVPEADAGSAVALSALLAAALAGLALWLLRAGPGDE